VPDGGQTSVVPAARDARPAGVRREAFVEPFRDLLAQVEATRQAALYCLFPSIEEHLGDGWVTIGGRRAASLIANDYLGLGGDAGVRAAAAAAIERLGASRCASPLVGGHTPIHAALEDELSAFLEQQATVTFASGYQANVGMISALMRPGDLVVTDLYDHASILDGARLSGAEIRFFDHNDPVHLGRVLRKLDGRRALVVVEGVYSADGDIVRLDEICSVAHGLGALVMVDEAHSLGVLGEGGRGAAERFGLLGEVDLIMGTMSKSLGSVGGFASGDRALIDAIRHGARALIFSAALPPANAAAALASLRALRERPELRTRLWENALWMRDELEARGFDTMGTETPVVPIHVGDPGAALAFATALRDAGVLVCPAIPPMVQASRSRVRMHVTAAHGRDALEHAVEAIAVAGAALGIGRGDEAAGA
jgi:8-amino-7-oxononanoate synthase